MAESLGVVVNMSVAAGIVILMVIVVRFLFARFPKIFSYLLWFPVLLRLLCPVALKADFGIVTDADILQLASASAEETAWEGVDTFAPTVAGTEENVDTIHIYEADNKEHSGNVFAFELSREKAGKLAIIWGLVGSILLLYEVISYCCFMHHVKPRTKERIVISPKVTVPFVAGIIRPVTYLPADLDEVQRELVTAHEKIHIKRLDYLVKPVFLFACCIHWFNPLVWLAYYLMIQDMESSCDEAVIRDIGYERKKEYAYTLLALSASGGWKVGCPIAFGENNVKGRIKNVIKIKKNKAWLIGIAAFVAGAVTMLLLVNRPNHVENVMDFVETNPDVTEQAEVQFLPAEEIVVLEKEKPKEEIKHEYYGGDDALTATDAAAPAEADKFAVLLQESPESYYDLKIAYRYPVEDASISNSYGMRVHPITGEERVHSGVDFAAEEGTKVVAAADGNVVETGFEAYCGNYVIIQHINGELTYYTSCKEILTAKGAEVKGGEQIATVGKTGASTGAHLHFAVSKEGVFLEPEFVVLQTAGDENTTATAQKLILQEELNKQEAMQQELMKAQRQAENAMLTE